MRKTNRHKMAALILCMLLCFVLAIPAYAANDFLNAEGTIQPDGSAIWQGHKYQVIYKQKYWQDAERYCEEQGGHLVTITSADEQAFIVSYLISQEAEGKFMLGLYSSNGRMGEVKQWVTGEKLEYTNWGLGQPSGNQSTAILSTIELGGSGWHISPYEWDDDAENVYAFICEWDNAGGEDRDGNNSGKLTGRETEKTENTENAKQSATGNTEKDRKNEEKTGQQAETGNNDDNSFDRWLFPELYEEAGQTEDEKQNEKDEKESASPFQKSQQQDVKDTGTAPSDKDTEENGDTVPVMNGTNVAQFSAMLADDAPADDDEGTPSLSTKPMRIYQEVGLYYLPAKVIARYGDSAESHLSPADIEVTMSGNDITVHMPMLAGLNFDCAADGIEGAAYWPEYANFRDELTLHGTICYTGTGREGDGYEYWDGQQRMFYYFTGTIDSVDGIVENGFSATFKETTGLGSQEICNVSHIGSYQRDGEYYKFSKFYLYYFPEDDFVEMCIELYGNYTVIEDYPQYEENPHETINHGGSEPYGIALVSEFKWDGFRTGDYYWDWMEWH